jgi:hypothetical protein
MAPDAVVQQIITEASTYLTYLLPVIAIMGAIMFIVSFVYYVITHIAQRTFN